MIDSLLSQEYCSKTNNCSHFFVKAWETVAEPLNSEGVCEEDFEIALISALDEFQRIERVSSPCAVLMSNTNAPSHLGLFFNNKVIHMTPQGVICQSLKAATISFSKVRFYKKK